MTDRGDERGHVVHRADEYDPEHNPDERGQPAELLTGHDGTGDGPSGRDGREVLPQQIEPRRGDEVFPVVDLNRWRRSVWVQPELATDEATVGVVPRRENDQDDACNQSQAHQA